MPTFNPCGTASAAKVPVKRYNLLLPAIYPVTEPEFDKAIPVNTERAIKKVSDYLESNEHRIPKVCFIGNIAVISDFLPILKCLPDPHHRPTPSFLSLLFPRFLAALPAGSA
jgi:hypothetical protein